MLRADCTSKKEERPPRKGIQQSRYSSHIEQCLACIFGGDRLLCISYDCTIHIIYIYTDHILMSLLHGLYIATSRISSYTFLKGTWIVMIHGTCTVDFLFVLSKPSTWLRCSYVSYEPLSSTSIGQTHHGSKKTKHEKRRKKYMNLKSKMIPGSRCRNTTIAMNGIGEVPTSPESACSQLQCGNFCLGVLGGFESSKFSIKFVLGMSRCDDLMTWWLDDLII